ncbi:MAG TPA: FAD:protein FMN transferase [Candidatus Saccharimonadales bacterium]|nr:FAD:protein FMN transferase [Candidatus Saccharimonadales bacterium]
MNKSKTMLPHSIRFSALGTQWRIDTEHALPSHIVTSIHQRIDAFDQTYSRFRPDSLVTRIAKTAGKYTFPADIIPIITLYRKLYDVTGGKVTPLIGSMLERAGYDAEYSFHEQPQIALPSWDAALDWQGATLTTTHPVTLDIGAAGKGYVVDCIAEILNAAQYTDYVIDASGDLRHQGTTENRVGLEHPFDQQKVIGVADVRGKSICASASNRRVWDDQLHHIFDPDTQAPVKDIVATWVIAETTMLADGLATALFFTNPQQLATHFDFQYVRMYQNGAIDYSHDFNGELF